MTGRDAVAVHGALGAAQLEVEALRSALAVTGADFIAATRERDAALAQIERLNVKVNLARLQRDYEIHRREELQQNCDRLRRKADLFSADLAERDATIELVRALVEDPHAALVVDRIRAALEEPSS